MLYVCVWMLCLLFVVRHGAVGAGVWECEWFVMQMLCVSCVHPVAVLNAAFCTTCSSLMLVKYARGNHVEETY